MSIKIDYVYLFSKGQLHFGIALWDLQTARNQKPLKVLRFLPIMI